MILTCPYCEHNAKMSSKRAGNYRREGTIYYVMCNKCRMRGPQFREDEKAAEDAWNKLPRSTNISGDN